MIVYDKMIEKMRENGVNASYIKTTGLFGQGTMTSIKRGESITMTNLNKLCAYFNCQPADLLEYVPTQDDIDAMTQVREKWENSQKTSRQKGDTLYMVDGKLSPQKDAPQADTAEHTSGHT